MFDFSAITVPQWFTSAIGVMVLVMIASAAKIWFEDYLRGRRSKRRVGARENDDLKGIHSEDHWTTRLIESLNRSADANVEVARALSILSGKQDATMEAFRLTQMQQAEANKLTHRVLTVVEQIQAAG